MYFSFYLLKPFKFFFLTTVRFFAALSSKAIVVLQPLGMQISSQKLTFVAVQSTQDKQMILYSQRSIFIYLLMMLTHTSCFDRLVTESFIKGDWHTKLTE